MKRRDLVNMLLRNGWELIRQKGDHDIFGRGSKRESIPRHTEINEYLARAIIKRQGLK